MQNFWLGKKLKRRLHKHIAAMILRIMGISENSHLNQEQLSRCVDYGFELTQQLGYSKALDELEKQIKTVIKIDRNRFVK